MAARTKGRPTKNTVTIEDCSSVKVFDNATVRCPHGKMWRESDSETVDKTVSAGMCDQSPCEAREFYPHVGESITLRRPRTYAQRQVFRDLWALTSPDPDAESVPALEPHLQALVSATVERWAWTGACNETADGCGDGCKFTGKPLPTPVDAWNTVRAHLEDNELWWIVSAAFAGGDPRTMKVAQGNT